MSKRLEELTAKYMQQLNISPWQVFPQDMAKFAELIIKECADIADKNSILSYPDHGIKIKRHFGID